MDDKLPFQTGIKIRRREHPKPEWLVPRSRAAGRAHPGQTPQGCGRIAGDMKLTARIRVRGAVLIIAAGLPAAPGRGAQAEAAAVPAVTNAHRVYSHLPAPREHPDYNRRAVKPPAWETFKNRTQFTCLRGFGEQGGRLVGFAEEPTNPASSPRRHTVTSPTAC
jgi:hypothetical protein